MLKKFRFFFIIFILILIFLPGFAKLQELRLRFSETETQTRKTQKENYLLEQKISQMQTNPEYVEIVAREKMGVVKKGETILRFVPADAGSNTTNQ
jgi:cell division protein FtsB